MTRTIKLIVILTFISLLPFACQSPKKEVKEESPAKTEVAEKKKIPILFDSDANNELDDQHALAYMLFNGETFDVRGVTVNATDNGGEIDQHYAEAERVMKLCGVMGKIPLYSGANGDFEEIRTQLDAPDYDGKKAVEFIIEESLKPRDQKLILMPVGKLTNIALALQKAPEIKDKVRIVWLGSNYPEPGEYNQVNDIPSMNYILDLDVPFEMVMVRYNDDTGSAYVKVTTDEVEKMMTGKGVQSEAVTGRHGKSFTNFGDYSLDLFKNAKMYGDPPSRSLFDMVAVAIVKNSSWGKPKTIPAPILIDEKWQERPENPRKVIIWEYFDKKSILDDFYATMENPVIAVRQ